jgi:hypothetical protein
MLARPRPKRVHLHLLPLISPEEGAIEITAPAKSEYPKMDRPETGRKFTICSHLPDLDSPTYGRLVGHKAPQLFD